MTDWSRRQIWVACALSLCCPGLGHLYSGRLQRGLVLFLVSLLILPIAALGAGLASSTGALVGLIVSFVALLGLWLFAVVDAWRITAGTTDTSRHDYQRPLIYALFVAAGISSPMLCVVYIRQNLLEAFYLPSQSMAPLLRSGDHILVNKTQRRIQNLKRWDVVVFHVPDQPGHNYIKRLVGLPGETVVIEGGKVKVNGQQADVPGDVSGAAPDANKISDPRHGQKPEVNQQKQEPGREYRGEVIPRGMCYVLGDNRNNSRDSREFGPVALGEILGVVEYIYLPGDSWSRFGTLP
jgi:signal peptidase I